MTGRGAAERGVGRRPPLRTRRASLVRFLEALQLLVAAAHDGVKRLFGRLLAGPDLLQFFVLDGANLDEVAQADAARLVGGLADHLVDGDVGAGVLLVKAGLFGERERRQRDRQIAGALMALGLDVGIRQVVEELSHALVLRRLLATHDPQRGAANHGVLWRTSDVGVVGQWGNAKIELGVLLDAGVGG